MNVHLLYNLVAVQVFDLSSFSLVQVTRNHFGHVCSSTRRKENAKNASKHWVCDKVKGWLLEDPKLGPKALQQKIREHYKIKVHYKRVYMGKELALK